MDGNFGKITRKPHPTLMHDCFEQGFVWGLVLIVCVCRGGVGCFCNTVENKVEISPKHRKYSFQLLECSALFFLFICFSPYFPCFWKKCAKHLILFNKTKEMWVSQDFFSTVCSYSYYIAYFEGNCVHPGLFSTYCFELWFLFRSATSDSHGFKRSFLLSE